MLKSFFSQWPGLIKESLLEIIASTKVLSRTVRVLDEKNAKDEVGEVFAMIDQDRLNRITILYLLFDILVFTETVL